MMKIGNRGSVMIEAITAVLILSLLSFAIFRLSLSRRIAVRDIEHLSDWEARAKILMEELKGSSLSALIRQVEDGRTIINISDMEFLCSSDSMNGIHMMSYQDEEKIGRQSTRIYAEIRPENDGMIRCPVLSHPGSLTNFVISPDMITDADRAIQDDMDLFLNDEQDDMDLFLDDDMERTEEMPMDMELLDVRKEAVKSDAADDAEENLILDETEDDVSGLQKILYIYIEENEARLRIRAWLEANAEETNGAPLSVDKELLDCERNLLISAADSDELLNRIYLFLPSMEEVTLDRIVFTGDTDRVCHCIVMEDEENGFRYRREDLLTAEEWVDISTNIQSCYEPMERKMEECTLSQLYSIYIWAKDAEDLRYEEDGHDNELCDYFSTKLETYEE